jgi:phage terminase large subunit-like protein
MQAVTDVSQADRKELERMYAELKYREQYERLDTFEPTAPGKACGPNKEVGDWNDQVGFINCTKPIQLIKGGNRSSKTEAAAVKVTLMAIGEHPTLSARLKPPLSIRALAPKWEDNIKEVILDKLKHLIPRRYLLGNSWSDAWSEKQRAVFFKNKSKIRFFTYEQDLNVMGGDDLDVVWGDEHMPYPFFLENLTRLVDRHGIFILTETFEKGVTWEEETIIDRYEEGDPDFAVFEFSSPKNPWLSKEGLELVKKTITDPRLYEAKILGKVVPLSGRVYDTFRHDLHVITPDMFPSEWNGAIPRNWTRACILDPHRRKPHYAVVLAFSPDGEIFAERHGRFASPEGVTQLKVSLRSLCAGLRISYWLMDQSGGADTLNRKRDNMAQLSFKDQLKAGIDGIPFKGTNQDSDNAFEAGWNKLCGYLAPDTTTNEPRFYIVDDGSPEAREAIRQMDNYHWKDNLTGNEETFQEKVSNVRDDYPTCYRYGCMMNINTQDQDNKFDHINDEIRSRLNKGHSNSGFIKNDGLIRVA